MLLELRILRDSEFITYLKSQYDHFIVAQAIVIKHVSFITRFLLAERLSAAKCAVYWRVIDNGGGM